jgi:hypothetical protein
VATVSELIAARIPLVCIGSDNDETRHVASTVSRLGFGFDGGALDPASIVRRVASLGCGSAGENMQTRQRTVTMTGAANAAELLCHQLLG